MRSRTGRERVLQQEGHRVVTLETDGETVRKTFIGSDRDSLLALAEREHDRLSRYSKALADVDGAACPSPVQLGRGRHPSVRMTRGQGQPLSETLRRPIDERDTQRLTRVLSDALSVYVGTFAEPYYDFHFRNMLYDASDRQITFLDFGVPDHLVPVRSALDLLGPVDVSLGNLYGSSLFEAVRPANLRRPLQNRRLLQLATSVIEAFVADGPAIPPVVLPDPEGLPDPDGVRKATEIVFRASASWGPRSHRVWYRLFPRHLANGEKRLDEVFVGAAPGNPAPAARGPAG